MAARRPVHVRRGRYETWRDPLPAIPDLRVLGRDSLRAVTGLAEHRHPGLEICYVERGAVTWWVGDEVHDLRGGDLFVTWPDEAHGGVDAVLHPCRSYWIELAFPRAAPSRWLGLGAGDARRLHRGLAGLPRRRFPAPPAVGRLFDRMFDAIAGRGELRAEAVRASILALLVETVERSGDAARARPIAPAVTAACARMESALARPLPLREVARGVGLSLSHFKRRFRAQMGIAPAEWYLRRRIAAARALLATSDEPEAAIAERLGFGSSRYLATCFQRVLGRKPASFRRKA
jgi:AraC-like DNA-binding protein